MRQIVIHSETWALQRHFSIARGRKTAADVIRVEISEGGVVGRGEAVPYPHYGESVETTTATLETLRPALAAGLTRDELADALLAGAARCAVDCALWDLEAKQTGVAVWDKISDKPMKDLNTAFTIVLEEPEKMAQAAKQAAAFPLLKLKLGGRDGMAKDILRLAACRQVRPDAVFITDANEGWRVEDVARYAEQLRQFDILFFEQPVPAAHDAHLADIDLPFCADESVHDRADLARLAPAYQWVNIKLDKAGGLSEALATLAQAREQNLKIMIGCMVATSLSMAPAHLLGQLADMVDLDGPLWLAQDCPHGLVYKDDVIAPPVPALWG